MDAPDQTLNNFNVMNISKEQVALAVQSGLELLGPKSEFPVPARMNDGVFFLRQLLIGIGQGQIALSSALQQEPAEPEEP